MTTGFKRPIIYYMNKNELEKPNQVLNTFLMTAMGEIGIPQEKLNVYRELVQFEWGRKEIADYACLLDLGAASEANRLQNARLEEIRDAMNTTELGKAKLQEMKQKGEELRKRGIDPDSAVPYPSFSTFQSQS